ncbi:MAG TPA: hypothetical protein VFM18_14895 [Methanosarcina sp.]|nr:hypothetical protein [Methanosarcina sp.]
MENEKQELYLSYISFANLDLLSGIRIFSLISGKNKTFQERNLLAKAKSCWNF